LQLRIGGIKGVAWRQGERASNLPTGETVNAVVSLRENIWNEKRSLEFVAEDIRISEPFNYQENLTSSQLENNVKVTRGKPTNPAQIVKTLEDLKNVTSQNIISKVIHFQNLPLGLSLQTTKELTDFFSSPLALSPQLSAFFDLSSTTLYDLEQLAHDYPTLNEVRKGFVFLQRGQTLPYAHLKTERIMLVLRELELLSEHNKPYRGQKRDPYSSETLMTGLLERYKLQTFVKAYKYLDDLSFANTVQTLFLAPKD
jgi:hypothetical protein